MNGMKKLSVIIMLLTLTACASGVHKTVYYEYRRPAQHVSVHKTVHRYQPIEVTLYADQSYRGRSFTTIQLVFADGDYVEIPMKNRRGQRSRIFAHYHEGVLHFDSDRNCHRIMNASHFKSDNGWHKGQTYSKISAGKDFDLNGLRLKVRNFEPKQKPVVAQKNDHKKNQGQLKTQPHSSQPGKRPAKENKFVAQHKKTVEKISIDSNRPDKAKPSREVVTKNGSAGRGHVVADNQLINSRKSAKPAVNKPQVIHRGNQPADHAKTDKPVAKNHERPKQKLPNVNQPEHQNMHMSKNKPRQPAARENVHEQKAKPSNKLNDHQERNQKSVAKSNIRNQTASVARKLKSEKQQVQNHRKDQEQKKDKADDEDDDEDVSDSNDGPPRGKGKDKHVSKNMK